MRYLSDNDIASLPCDWRENIRVLESAIRAQNSGDSAQPLKPYLRYGEGVNRIIAMPAYVGGAIDIAGIKWIASFPGNIQRGIPRAHSVTILNDGKTGVPIAIFNTARISALRTAAVSGLIVQHVLAARPSKRWDVGIIGWGPVGQMHFRMLRSLFGESIGSVRVFDLRSIDATTLDGEKTGIIMCGSWEEAYASDIVATCTVSDHRYIDASPKAGAILLNISLRDYLPSILSSDPLIIVDDWAEVCRENTDIEVLHQARGLEQGQVMTIADLVAGSGLHLDRPDQPIFFNPMGMAIFDISIASHYLALAKANGKGHELR